MRIVNEFLEYIVISHTASGIFPGSRNDCILTINSRHSQFPVYIRFFLINGLTIHQMPHPNIPPIVLCSISDKENCPEQNSN